MRVKAKHWLTYEGVWHRADEEFEISATDADSLAGMIEITETPIYADDLPALTAAAAAQQDRPASAERKATARKGGGRASARVSKQR